MLLAAITDPQEAQFRKLGVQLRNSPQMLRDLLYRSIEEIAPTAFLPVVEAGIADVRCKWPNRQPLQKWWRCLPIFG